MKIVHKSWISRNLIEEDYIKFAFGINISPSDIPMMGISAIAITPFVEQL